MQIFSLSKIIILPLVVSALIILYIGEANGNYDMTVWVVIPVILFAIVIIFMGQIDYWYHKRFPLPLDQKIVEWMQRFNPYYIALDDNDKKKFRDRLSLYIEGREFKSVGKEVRDVPEDIKGIIGSIPVMLTFHGDDFLLGDYDYVYLYKHPFPSPQYQYLHTVEVNHEDGVFLFSLEHLLPGITRSDEFYNIGLHAYVEAYINVHKLNQPDDITWEDIEQISPYSKEDIIKITGHKEINIFAVLITCYFMFPEKMKTHKPAKYRELELQFTTSNL